MKVLVRRPTLWSCGHPPGGGVFGPGLHGGAARCGGAQCGPEPLQRACDPGVLGGGFGGDLHRGGRGGVGGTLVLQG